MVAHALAEFDRCAAEPLPPRLRQLEAERLLAFLDWFLPAPLEFIPDNSLLREFVGGSSLKDFKLWAAK